MCFNVAKAPEAPPIIMNIITSFIKPGTQNYKSHLLSSQLAKLSLCSGFTWSLQWKVNTKDKTSTTKTFIFYENFLLLQSINCTPGFLERRGKSVQFTCDLKNFAASCSLSSGWPCLPIFSGDHRAWKISSKCSSWLLTLRREREAIATSALTTNDCLL